MQTYNQIIKLNREFAQAHWQIKTFGNGEIYNVVLHDKEEWFEYPLMWMQDLPSTLNNNEFSFNFRVHFIAQVAQVKEIETDLDSTNENEVKSDMIQCAQDLLAFWAQDSTYPELDLVKTGVSFTTVTDKFSDRVTGCYVDLRLKQGFTYNKCAIPMSDVPQPPLICLPVDIELNGVSMGTVASGGTYEGNIINQDDEQVGEKVGDDWVVNVEGDPATYRNSDDSFTQSIPSGDTYTAPDIVNQVNGVDQDPIPANTSTNYIVEGDPSTVELNGTSLTDVPSGENKDMTITYENGDPVTITTVTDTANVFEGTVPNPVIHNSLPINSGAYILGSFNSGDDANINFGRGNATAPWYLLEEENPFGNLYAMTGKMGGYQSYIDNLYYDKDGVLTTEVGAFPDGVILNWKSYKTGTGVLALSKELVPIDDQDDMLTNAPYTRDSKSDWEVWNIQVAMFFYCGGIYRNEFNYPPLNYDMASSANYLWTSYKDNANAGLRLAQGQIQISSDSVTYFSYCYRVYTPIELGISF